MHIINCCQSICENNHYSENNSNAYPTVCGICGGNIVYRNFAKTEHNLVKIIFTKKGLVTAKCVKDLIASDKQAQISHTKKTVKYIKDINKLFKTIKETSSKPFGTLQNQKKNKMSKPISKIKRAQSKFKVGDLVCTGATNSGVFGTHFVVNKIQRVTSDINLKTKKKLYVYSGYCYDYTSNDMKLSSYPEEELKLIIAKKEREKDYSKLKRILKANGYKTAIYCAHHHLRYEIVVDYRIKSLYPKKQKRKNKNG